MAANSRYSGQLNSATAMQHNTTEYEMMGTEANGDKDNGGDKDDGNEDDGDEDKGRWGWREIMVAVDGGDG